MEYLKNKGKLLAPTPVRLSEPTDKALDAACATLNLAKQDVIRLALDIGLKHLEAVKYDLAACVLNESGRLKK